MFNWFRRQFGKDTPSPESVTPEVTDSDVVDSDVSEESPEPSSAEAIALETVPTSEEETETNPAPALTPVEETVSAPPDPNDYLTWAKTAYQNIQARKGDSSDSAETEVGQPPASEAEEIALENSPAITDAPSPGLTETVEGEKAGDAETGPAWLQKSDRLEALKETAIEEATVEGTLTAESMALDDDFIWSAKVLAAQGRSAEDVSAEEIDWLRKLRQGLSKTRVNLVNQLKAIVGQGPLNEEAVEEIEALLLQADVGIDATDYIISTLQAKLREEALPPDQAIEFLKEILRSILDRPLLSLSSQDFVPEADCLNVWLLTGVNGAGKTTTIGKLAHMAKQSGYDCVIAAADTFRAAAVEQVKVWGERSGVPVIANPGQNTDPAAVVYDGISAAQSRNVNLLLVDTAGRLQNKKNLMDELAKIRRIIDKKAPDATVESLLVLDATLGQNGLRQAEVFAEAAKLSGVVLTKLDGSAKGGVALAVAQQLNLPIRFIGAGEGIEDLRPFSSYEFVEALLNG
ncbi:MAG: signal recognition particle-docking protein FtsY [Synechocystis sp.]|nr:signal recognition particle-docking protein FtsY [Synechocystis sp.]